MEVLAEEALGFGVVWLRTSPSAGSSAWRTAWQASAYALRDALLPAGGQELRENHCRVYRLGQVSDWALGWILLSFRARTGLRDDGELQASRTGTQSQN